MSHASLKLRRVLVICCIATLSETSLSGFAQCQQQASSVSLAPSTNWIPINFREIDLAHWKRLGEIYSRRRKDPTAEQRAYTEEYAVFCREQGLRYCEQSTFMNAVTSQGSKSDLPAAQPVSTGAAPASSLTVVQLAPVPPAATVLSPEEESEKHKRWIAEQDAKEHQRALAALHKEQAEAVHVELIPYSTQNFIEVEAAEGSTSKQRPQNDPPKIKGAKFESSADNSGLTAAQVAAMPDSQRRAYMIDKGTSMEWGISKKEKARRQGVESEAKAALKAAQAATATAQNSVVGSGSVTNFAQPNTNNSDYLLRATLGLVIVGVATAAMAPRHNYSEDDENYRHMQEQAKKQRCEQSESFAKLFDPYPQLGPINYNCGY